jgi:hypothetical protein
MSRPAFDREESRRIELDFEFDRDVGRAGASFFDRYRAAVPRASPDRFDMLNDAFSVS